MSLIVASSSRCPTQKTGVVVLVSLAFIVDDDQSSRLRQSSRREVSSFGLIRLFDFFFYCLSCVSAQRKGDEISQRS